MSEIRAFKITNGDEIIAQIEQDFNDKVVISKPRMIKAMPMQNGQVGIGMIPWIYAGADAQPITLFFSNIITVVEPIEEMKTAYLHEVSGIDLSASAPKSILHG